VDDELRDGDAEGGVAEQPAAAERGQEGEQRAPEDGHARRAQVIRRHAVRAMHGGRGHGIGRGGGGGTHGGGGEGERRRERPQWPRGGAAIVTTLLATLA